MGCQAWPDHLSAQSGRCLPLIGRNPWETNTPLRLSPTWRYQLRHKANDGLVNQIMLDRLVLERPVSQTQRLIIAQFLRFGTVGGIGFLIDTAAVYGLRHILGLYGAGLIAYVVAATGNWALNRIWTFRGHGSGPAYRQWTMFMVTNLAGFVLNRGAYVLLVTFVAAATRQPVIATAAGAVAGMFANFSLSRRLVFR
jgi:putative flippase GtrA